MSEPDYAMLESAVARAKCRWGIAEAHGTLCGLICGNGAAGVDRWRAEFGAAALNTPIPGDVDDMLADIASETGQRLSGSAFQFQPLLPDDDTSLSERAGELAQWCQGFLYGCALAGIDNIDNPGGDVAEVIGDFSELSNAGFDDDDEPTEQDETAYAELVEFVRVGVQLVYEEMAAPRGAAN